MNKTTDFNHGKAPAPPTLHWAIVLVLSLVTFGLFGCFWMFRQAWFARKLNPDNRAVLCFAIAFLLALFSILLRATVAITVARGGEATETGTTGLVLWMFQVLAVAGGFLQIRETLMGCYGIRLNAALTVLFNMFYIQHHLTLLGSASQASAAPGGVGSMPTRATSSGA